MRKSIAVTLALVLSVASANAAGLKLTGNIVTDAASIAKPAPLIATPAPANQLASLMAKLAAIKLDIVTNTVADLTAADADASAINAVTGQMNDPISHACYPALVTFLKSLPTATPPTGTYVAIQIFQKQRDFVAQIQAGIPTYLKLGCAPLIGDEAQIFVKAMSLVGVTIGTGALTGLFPAAAPLTLPALGALAL